MPSRIDDAILQMALIGYRAEISRIEQKMTEIRRQLGGSAKQAAATTATPKRVLSVAARARIAAAQKKRWAQFHKGKDAAVTPEAPKAKRRISAEGLKRIIAATKKRWAAQRAAAAKPAPSKTKKAVGKKTRKTPITEKSPVRPFKAKKAVGKKAAVKAAPPKPEVQPEAPAQ